MKNPSTYPPLSRARALETLDVANSTTAALSGFKPKVGRAPWVTPPKPRGERMLASAPPARRDSGSDWDARIALSLIFLIIAVNVALTMLLSSDSSMTEAAEGQVSVSARQVPESDFRVEVPPSTAQSAAREELLSIISKY